MNLNKQPTVIIRILVFGIGIILYSNVFAAPTSSIFATKDDLDTEISGRIAADEVEATTRGAADITLQGNIDAEATTRENADTALQSQIDSISSPTLYAIGNTGPGGGIVFHISDDGEHGLEAAPDDQDDGSGIQWVNGVFTNTHAVKTGINDGSFNTDRIIIGQGNGVYAALLCANYNGGGYGDWYLPSKDELNLMWENLADSDGGGTNSGPGDLGNLGGFSNGGYWSSSEFSIGGAYAQSFNNGDQAAFSKSNPFRVRAVRAF